MYFISAYSRVYMYIYMYLHVDYKNVTKKITIYIYEF